MARLLHFLPCQLSCLFHVKLLEYLVDIGFEAVPVLVVSDVQPEEIVEFLPVDGAGVVLVAQIKELIQLFLKGVVFEQLKADAQLLVVDVAAAVFVEDPEDLVNEHLVRAEPHLGQQPAELLPVKSALLFFLELFPAVSLLLVHVLVVVRAEAAEELLLLEGEALLLAGFVLNFLHEGLEVAGEQVDLLALGLQQVLDGLPLELV